MKDQLTRLIINNEVRVMASDTTHLVEEAKAIHKTFPVATAVLGLSLIHILP